MINFSVGPVQSAWLVRNLGKEQVPYFRTPEFSEIMIQNEKYLLEFSKAPQNSRAVFLTGSGTAAMEAAVMNFLGEKDRVLVVNGGSFGSRFVELCKIHEIPFDEILLKTGQSLTEEHLAPYENHGYSAMLINIHETSTGVLYDSKLVGEFCKRNNMFLIVDAISSFLADPFDMASVGADVMIAGSQKAIACPPGISMLVLSPRALHKINKTVKSMYLNLNSALENGIRGQTPFTPAVGILLQIHARFKQIEQWGGVDVSIRRVAEIACDFRKKFQGLPLEISSESLSNAVTPLATRKEGAAYEVFLTLKDEYGIWICPNGGELKDRIFRVGHIGNLKKSDNDKLISALWDLARREII